MEAISQNDQGDHEEGHAQQAVQQGKHLGFWGFIQSKSLYGQKVYFWAKLGHYKILPETIFNLPVPRPSSVPDGHARWWSAIPNNKSTSSPVSTRSSRAHATPIAAHIGTAVGQCHAEMLKESNCLNAPTWMRSELS